MKIMTAFLKQFYSTVLPECSISSMFSKVKFEVKNFLMCVIVVTLCTAYITVKSDSKI